MEKENENNKIGTQTTDSNKDEVAIQIENTTDEEFIKNTEERVSFTEAGQLEPSSTKGQTNVSLIGGRQPLEINNHGEIDRAFFDPYYRAKFIRKVYMLLTFCLMLNFIMVATAIFIQPVKEFYIRNSFLILILSLVITLIIILAFCFEGARKIFPWNIILLLLYVISLGALMSVVCIRYDIQVIFLAFAVTLAVSFTLTIFAFITSIDFTKWYLYVVISILVIFIFSFVQLFIHNRILNLVLAIIIVLLFSFKLICDTQAMLGGKHRYVIHPSEYICATLSLYIDIVNIFLAFLQIFGNN